MKFFLLMVIQFYWILIPKSKRRRCLFKISCSNYVYANTKENGLISGLKALKFRVENCNSNYSLIEVNEEKILVSKTNETFKIKELNETILN